MSLAPRKVLEAQPRTTPRSAAYGLLNRIGLCGQGVRISRPALRRAAAARRDRARAGDAAARDAARRGHERARPGARVGGARRSSRELARRGDDDADRDARDGIRPRRRRARSCSSTRVRSRRRARPRRSSPSPRATGPARFSAASSKPSGCSLFSWLAAAATSAKTEAALSMLRLESGGVSSRAPRHWNRGRLDPVRARDHADDRLRDPRLPADPLIPSRDHGPSRNAGRVRARRRAHGCGVRGARRRPSLRRLRRAHPRHRDAARKAPTYSSPWSTSVSSVRSPTSATRRAPGASGRNPVRPSSVCSRSTRTRTDSAPEWRSCRVHRTAPPPPGTRS